MDTLWTPWRYHYITRAAPDERKGVPDAMRAWPGEDRHCVFCNLLASVDWALGEGMPVEEAEGAGLVLARMEHGFLCLNRFPYNSGHVLVVPYVHQSSLAALPGVAAEEMMRAAQKLERVLGTVYRPDGINLGMNLGEAAGAGVAGHVHLHVLPRWTGDASFMTVTAQTRVLPELLEQSWARIRTEWQAKERK